ncbi:MAG: MFS transporter [Syntrophomonadaceae bacterium]
MVLNREKVDINLLIVFGITLMSTMGVAAITPAFPLIMEELELTRSQVAMLITVFTLPGIFLSPFLGVIADRLGRKKALVPSLFLFGVSGGMCGFVSDINLLLFLRFIQGFGAAAVGSLSPTIIGDLYEGQKRLRHMGQNASAMSIGTASFPVVGGALAAFSWHYPFFISWLAIPLGLIVLKLLKNPEPKSSQGFRQYLDGTLHGMKNKRVVGIFFLVTALWIIIFGPYLTYLSLLLGDIFNAEPYFIGIVQFSMSITTATVASQIGRINRHLKRQTMIKISFIGYIISMLVMPFVPRVEMFFLVTLFLGLTHGMNMPSLQTLLAEQAPLEHRAAFMSLNGSCLRLGQTVGPVLATIAFSLGGYQAAFWSGSGMGLVGLLVVFLTLSESKASNTILAGSKDDAVEMPNHKPLLLK